MKSVLHIAIILSALSALAPRAAAEPRPVDYSRDVQPLLAEHCFHCHGRDEGSREGGLRLDVRELALQGGDSEKPAIVPGHPERSELLARITSPDADEVMPPRKQNHPVKAADVGLLRRWIADGAPYGQHWAFVAPVKAPLPKGSKQPVDAFIGGRLKAAGLKMSEPAPATTLCRRLYLDLIGLPPAPAEVDKFVAQATSQGTPAAASALAEQLMNDRRFGEKWARLWLDVARFADSNGYEKDLPREQWIWRDWVINALNADMPYNQFLVEQVAGDLLPHRTPEQLIATGFLRNGMVNEEGAIVPEQFRMEGMFDRLDVIGTGILGMSLKCAQCHSHKFDPISHAEYYQTFAFLNNTYEAQSWIYNEAQQREIDDLLARIFLLEARLKEEHHDWRERFNAWLAVEAKAQSAVPWIFVEADDLHSSSELNHPTMLADKSITVLGHRTIHGDVHMFAEPKVTGVTGIRVEILKYGDLPFGGPGRSFKGTWALTELVVEAKQHGTDKWERLKLKNVTADFAEPEGKMEPEWENASRDKDHKRTRGPAKFLADGDEQTAWRADRGPGRRNSESVAVAQFESPVTLPEGTRLKVALVTNHGGDDNGPKNTQIGRFRVSLTTAPDPKVNGTPYAAVLALQTPAERRTAAQNSALFAAWRATVPAYKTINDEIDSLWKKYPEAMTSVLHLAERSGDDARDTFLLDRGGWDRPKAKVQPGVIAAFHPLPTDAPQDRLTFARWLADRRSPLTARVAVNRIWQAIFGLGLQETAEDFGTRGSEPTHPELLDWLAVDFMQHRWSQKHVIRQIVNSAAYQQSSRVTPELLEKDSRNRLVSRGPRFRADAEVVRDIAIGTSGLLSSKFGGPSLFPPVPQNVLEYNYFKPTYWQVAEGPDRYCRSLYVFRKRSMPDPLLSSFDAPNGDFTCPRRARSNSPLAALTSLNEPVFVEAAQAMALRVLREGGKSDPERIDYAYRLCTGRPVQPAERDEVLKLLASRRRQLAEGWLSMREIATGDPAKLPKLPTGATPQDAAAWTIVARVLLNLDETLNKN
ncbi:MAG: PSD1 domain-containing protein [Planctomycetes bacterium]|nr:PSD1 domain-containing protein [Planctomycetota bacterium]